MTGAASDIPALATVERWFLRAGLFVLPWAFGWGAFDQYVMPKLVVARALFIGLLILFAARAALSGKVVVKRTPVDLPLLALLASAVLSTILAENQNMAVFGTYSRYDGLLTLIMYAGLFWLSVQTLKGPDDARGLLRVLLAAAYVVAVTAILQAVRDSLRQGEVAAAFGTMGNSNVLGAFLAMAFALGLGELAAAQSASGRIMAVNVLIVVGLALLMSFSRSGWLGAALGAAIVAAGSRRSATWVSMAAALGGILAALLAVAFVAGRSLGGAFELERQVVYRGLTVFNFSEWGSSRLHIWVDSFHLIASRPVTGYGPDNFGLVFPRFESGDWGLSGAGFHQQVDKAHAETLQVAATQGLIGLAAYLWILVAFGRAFWGGRRHPGAVGVFAAFVAYQVTIQLNFTALAAAFPFWILVAAAMLVFGAATPSRALVVPWRAPLLAASALLYVALVALTLPAVVYPYAAEVELRQAIDANMLGRPGDARAAIDLARSLAPQESVYAVEAADLASEGHDLNAAREAFLDAIRLGTYNPFVYMNLALVDIDLGRRDEALWAARMAVELNRFDPAFQALVAQLEAPAP
jgi:putative inorganic carbon (HCO3(-)) transporter